MTIIEEKLESSIEEVRASFGNNISSSFEQTISTLRRIFGCITAEVKNEVSLSIEAKAKKLFTPLAYNEIKFIIGTVEKMPREDVLSRLKADLQSECEIELASIPIYLYSYYSLQLSQNVINGLH